MNDEEVEALLNALEQGLADLVRNELSAVASEFADALDDADELVAAVFSVSRIADMWRRRTGSIMTRLRSIVRRGAETVAEDLGEPVPSAEDLAPVVDAYVANTQPLVDAVGDHLAQRAVDVLNEGVAAGDSLDELKSRLSAVFDEAGPQLGSARTQRIASTESHRAFNAGALAAAQALTGPDRPLVKQWLTRNDEKVRQAHRDANGQLQFLDDPFDVGGTPMQYPGDPTAPADLTIQCRCILRAATAPERNASMEPDTLSASDGAHKGAMIALMPSAVDASRMAVTGGEEVDQLHVTLAFLGEAADWTPAQRASLIEHVQYEAQGVGPVHGKAFGIARWNPLSEEPVWVWNIGDDLDHDCDRLGDAKRLSMFAMEDADTPPLPVQHSPWSPHMTITYGGLDQAEANAAIGPVVFDRIVVAFGGQFTEIPLVFPSPVDEPPAFMGTTLDSTTLSWSTPGDTALAFENQQTGDGRVFSPGALHWGGVGPWPLQYADAMLGGHDGARLAGSIQTMGRDGDRITGAGVLFLTQDAGLEAGMLLAQKAPLGVSVDLDDVDLEMVSVGDTPEDVFRTRLVTASLLPSQDGGWILEGETALTMAASGGGTMTESQRVRITAGPDGHVPAGLFELSAAAGDPDVRDGAVVDQQLSGEFLMRITRGRVRGATLVTIPAYANARIVLDETFLTATTGTDLSAAAAGSDYDRVVRQVRKTVGPSTASELARFLKLPVAAVRRYLARAAKKGDLVRLTRGAYVAPVEEATASTATPVAPEANSVAASVTGAVDLPVADRDRAWDGDAAATRVFDWADGDTARIGKAFAYRDDDKDPGTKGAYKLGYADVIDGKLTIVPAGVSAAIGALHGARGGVDLPDSEREAVADRLDAVAAHVSEETGEDEMNDMTASAWAALADLPPMPAAWFREPTLDELPPGGTGVNYAGGRIFGWVAQAGEPHAGFAKKITIDGLGRIDTTHFLRQRFTLDDGSTVKAGAYTMNAGHHRDGAECETASCQFDDTRTVAGIVTVGMNERGMWFSGAAAPWMSEWDRTVFMATQPSYHMRKGPSGNWQLRAVLSVPVPGHSSPLLASAVVERSQLALTAALVQAGEREAEEAAAVQAAQEVAPVDMSGIDYDRLADAIVAAGVRAEERRSEEAAKVAAIMEEVAQLSAEYGTEGN